MILYMYIVLNSFIFCIVQGHTTPWGQTFNVNRKPLSLCPFVASLKKKKSDFIHILMILYMYIAPGTVRQSLGDKLLMSTESPYHFARLLQV